MLDDTLVAIALAASAAYALWALGPKSLRRRLGSALAALAARAPAGLHLEAVARRLRETSAHGGGACGGCESCAPQADAPLASAPAEVRVPLANIGKREGTGRAAADEATPRG
ncbi:MAG TPA: DUF6587 family protein [Steroidobacteraceae bacterium]|nr:DUF6587 family protein [Steroidobacteraceae bacterium]